MGWMVVATPYTIPEGEEYMETLLKYTLKLIGEATVTQQKTYKTTFKNLHRRCTNNIITETVPLRL